MISLAAVAVNPPAASAGDFLRPQAGYEFAFPRDHGSHPAYAIEWWYFTGNLEADGRGEYGYELALFRTGLIPPGGKPEGASDLMPDELFFAHFAISDIDRRTHHFWEEIGRPALGQASASTETLDVRCGGWRAWITGEGSIRLQAQAESFGVDLVLEPAKPLVIHGEDGLHQKADDPGQASHYYSFTRLQTTGTIRVGGEDVPVSGLSWMDHEFGNDMTGGGIAGWDWFAIQLDNGTDVMVYQLRRPGGAVNPHSIGTVVSPDGIKEILRGTTDYRIEATGTWKSPESGAEYPMGWEIEFPERGDRLRVRERFQEQEMRTTRTAGVTYWEGAVSVSGTWKGEAVRGKGYVELVGYEQD